MESKIKMMRSLLDADISDMSREESEKLIDQLRNSISDTKEMLQTTNKERERMDKDMERWVLMGDRLSVAVKHGESLRAWDADRKRKLTLSRQLEELEVMLSSTSGAGEVQVKETRREKAYLLKEEKRLTRLCSEARQALAEAQSRSLAEEEFQRLQSQVAMAAPGSQSQKGKEEQPVDEHTAKLNASATARRAGVPGARKQRTGLSRK